MSGDAGWADAAPLQRLREAGPLTIKLRGRQLALFLHQDVVHACNNRCPHEAYPLAEGTLDERCVLTCHWHNWKFDLRSGANLVGGDALRIYPARVQDGRVWVDLSDPPPAQRIAAALAQLDAALAEHDPPRIARELARLERLGASPEQALVQAIARSHERLRYGMTHAYAAAEVWLRLRDALADPVQRLACATEALAHVGLDTLREPVHAYTEAARPWQPQDFLAAVEAQDEDGALALLQGALDGGLDFEALEPVLAEAALAHYNDFGHSVIYLSHLRGLLARLGPAVLRPLLRAWLRALVFATREDLLPDFRAYAAALARWPGATPQSGAAPAPEDFEGRSVRQTLDATLAAAALVAPEAALALLLQAAAHHLLRFDEAVAQRTDNAVADNVGWLDFSHALTFGHALRGLCGRRPQLWPQGLLQMALFVARNSAYLQPGVDAAAALARWRVDDVEVFDARCRSQLLDHGLGLPIFPAHWLKTWMAVRDSVALGLPEATRGAMLAALNRLFAARFKQRHVLRTAHQALHFVARES